MTWIGICRRMQSGAQGDASGRAPATKSIALPPISSRNQAHASPINRQILIRCDALPILKHAEVTTAVRIDAQTDRESEQSSGQDICEARCAIVWGVTRRGVVLQGRRGADIGSTG